MQIRTKNNYFPEGEAHTVIKSFNPWILFLSKRYALNNTIQPYELQDLRQFIQLRLLEIFPKLKHNFKGNSKIRTYISAVILNLCSEFRRKNCSRSILTEELKEHESLEMGDTDLSNEKKLIIQSEIEHFELLLVMYGSKSAKIKLSLKMFYGLDLSLQDMLDYCKTNDLVKKYFLNAQSNKVVDYKKKEAIATLTDLFNEVENKNNSTEATRKWIIRTIKDIIHTLNKSQSKFDKHTLGLLIEVWHKQVENQ